MKTKKKVLVIVGNPSKNSFTHFIARSIAGDLVNSDIRVIDLAKIKFDPILHESYKKQQKLELDLIQAQKNLLWADHVIIIYPTWWGLPPGILKGFIDRVFLPGFAFKYGKDNGIPSGLLIGKSATIITTTGGPNFFYFLFGHPGNRAIKYFVLKFCGFRNIKSYVFSSIRNNKFNLYTIQKKLKRVVSKI